MSDSTLRARRDEWIDAGVFEQLKSEALAAFDRIIGLDLMIEHRFDVDPRRAGHQPDQDTSEAQPIRDSQPLTTQRVRAVRWREQRFNR